MNGQPFVGAWYDEAAEWAESVFDSWEYDEPEPPPELKRQPFVAGLGQHLIGKRLDEPEVRHASFVYDGRELYAISPRAWAERGVPVITRLGVESC